MDTAIIVGVIVGSVVAIALVFGKTVLGVAWTGNGTKRVTAVESGNENKIIQQGIQDKNEVSIKKASSISSKDTGDTNFFPRREIKRSWIVAKQESFHV